jgi:hypothetical protein
MSAEFLSQVIGQAAKLRRSDVLFPDARKMKTAG